VFTQKIWNGATIVNNKFPPPLPGKTGWPWDFQPEKVSPGFDLPRVTIVTPSYNHAAYLEETIRSVLRQEHGIALDLILVGSDQGNFQYVQNLVESLRLQACVHFLRFVPREDLLALYVGAFALTYVTFFGPENLPPLEVFAGGYPVIASDVAGAAEQLGDAALRVNASQPEEIAAAVKKLHDDPQFRAALIARGTVRSKEFTGQDYVRGVFEMFDEIESIRVNWK